MWARQPELQERVRLLSELAWRGLSRSTASPGLYSANQARQKPHVTETPLRFARTQRYKQQRQHDVGLHGRRQALGRAGAGCARAHELRRKLQWPLQWHGRSPRGAVRLASEQHAASVPCVACAAQLCTPRAGRAEARAAGGCCGSAGGDRCRPAMALSSNVCFCAACL